MIFTSMDAFSQSYNELWGLYNDAVSKDLPRTQMDVLQNIIAKATKEKEYGHLVKAQLANLRAVSSITPDSLKPEVLRLEKTVEKADNDNPVLAAVYHSLLGYVYSSNYSLNREYPTRAAEHRKMSIANLPLLASTKAGSYVPTVVEGADSKYFDNDLLHVVCFYNRDYATMHDYYCKSGNREAACISACEMLRNAPRTKADRRAATSPLIHRADSLLQIYGDLPVAGELALLRYEFMTGARDVTAAQKMEFINDASEKWAAWPRISEMQNHRNHLTQPTFGVDVGCVMIRPSEVRTVHFNFLRNIKSLSFTISKVDIDVSRETYNLHFKPTLEKVKKAIVKGTTCTIIHQFTGHQEYDIFEDSVSIGPLSKGVYLLEVASDNEKIDVARTFVYVSDVYVVNEALPRYDTRFAVVSATTGKPLKNAKIRVDKGGKETLLSCDTKGEVVCNLENLKEGSRTYGEQNIFAYTTDDSYCPYQNLWRAYYSYSFNDHVRNMLQLYTDRSIYRPGQKVEVSLIAFTLTDGIETKATEGKTVEVRLHDANGKRIGSQSVVTDEYGKAATSFILPENVLPGWFSINTSEGGRISLRVEEYKRPTFQVEMPEVTEKYAKGDTVRVKGYARTYAGVPVQGAEVRYTVSRRVATWWWGEGKTDELLTDTVTTDNDGAFEMTLPMIMPDETEDEEEDFYGWRINRFYEIVASAVVTDVAGESHSGNLWLPLSDKETALGFSMPSKIVKGKMSPVTFNLRNASGNPIDGEVTYYIDNDEKAYTAKANEPVQLPTDGPLAKLGQHCVTAVCLGDTVKREFILFTLEDKKPVIETHDWFYTNGSEFPSDGSPVSVQVGSSDPDTYVLYNIFSGERIIEQGSFVLDNANKNLKLTYKEEYADGITLTFAWVREGKLYTHRHSIRRPMPDKRILMKWETFRDKLTPGAQEEWTLKATYPDGRPANAQLMATLYDMSLDQIQSHGWNFNTGIGVRLPYTYWRGMEFNNISLLENQVIRYVNVPDLMYSHFDRDVIDYWGPRIMAYGGGALRAAPNMMMKNAAVESEAMEMADVDIDMDAAGMTKKDQEDLADEKAADEQSTANEKDTPQIRENFNETAFFIPQAVADAEGRISLKFTLPESVTTWRFIGMASDRDINYGITTAQAVAKKDVMVIPNMPRFVRTGDKATISARLANTTDHAISGKATMQLLDPETQNVVYSQTADFDIDANSTKGLTFSCQPDGTTNLLVCRIMAQGEGFSDGEQHYLPILPDKELVTRTVPFTQHGPGITTIDLQKLFPKGVDGEKLTVEYTNNPAWLMIQTLPLMAADDRDNAISLAMVVYANSIGKHIMSLSPEIKNTVLQWTKEQGDQNSLTSSLAKNPELRDILLNETPWVGAADREESQKQNLVKFFDTNSLDQKLDKALAKLTKLQLSDGSWSWWQGMKGSPYMTTAVSEMLIRLDRMTGENKKSRKLVEKAYKFTDNYLIEEEAILREYEKKGKRYRPSETAINILYNYALDQRKTPQKMAETVEYLVSSFEKRATEFTIYGKARAAVVLAYYGRTEKAAEYMQSVEQYSVVTEEMGRYFDTRKAYYSWCSYNIPTEVAAIEAYKMLQPNNVKVVDEMRKWLLQQKRAQMWNSPINTVDAVYAFLEGNMQSLETGQMATLSVDGETLQTSEATAGLGYVKTALDAAGKNTFEAEKTTQGTSWGALYAQFTQHTAEVENSSAQLSVKREILHNGDQLRVGDKVTVRITVKAERDLDFVEVIDRRAACMEPVDQLSGYRSGYYLATKDYTTTFYFNRMAKGTHVMEKTYYIDREGTYQTGTCKAQCAYAPEFSATSHSLNIVVKK